MAQVLECGRWKMEDGGRGLEGAVVDVRCSLLMLPGVQANFDGLLDVVAIDSAIKI